MDATLSVTKKSQLTDEMIRSVMSNNLDPINGKVLPVFFHYAIASVLGMLAAASAVIIDVGSFVKSCNAQRIAIVLLNPWIHPCWYVAPKAVQHQT